MKVLSEKELQKKYAGSKRASVMLLEDYRLKLPTRVIPLNHQLGGGLPSGRIMELIGMESTGKTLLTLDFAFVTQELGGVVLWDDAERVWDNSWAKKSGIRLDQIEVLEEEAVEVVSDWMKDQILYLRSSVLKNNEPILLVIDSLAGLDTMAALEIEQSTQKATMGNRAKEIYNMYRKRNSFFSKYGVHVIVINQLRDKVGAGMYEDNTTTPGGNSTKFYASIREMIARGKQIKGIWKGEKFKALDVSENSSKGIKIGQNVYLRNLKNKTAAPGDVLATQVYFKDYMYGYVGYNRYMGLDSILVEKSIIQKKGGNIYYRDSLIAKSEAGFVTLMHEDEDIRRKLIRKSGINTISQARSFLEGLSKNYYPVKGAKFSEDDSDS